MFHLPVSEALFEWYAESLEACASRLDVVHGDCNVAKPFRVGITRVIGRSFECLRAVIVGELEDA